MAESTGKAGSNRVDVRGTAGLAQHLGISRWTVSRVLNGHSGVREETRQRVLEAMAELGFEPNRLARGLRGVPSGVVGVSFPHLEAMVLARKSQALQRELREAGFRGIFEIPEGDADIEAAVVRHFLSIQVDGIVLIGSTLSVDSPVLSEVAERGIGIVAVDPTQPLRIPRVTLDRGQAMELMLGYLVDLGHRKIGLLGFNSDDMYPAVRRKGLERAAGEHGVDFSRDLQSFDLEGFGHQDYRLGAILGEQVLALGKKGPTALLCLNDRIAIGAMRTLQEAGRSIPGDYSIIGFDNLPETAWTNPPLSTVDHNINRLMEQATRLLWQSVRGEATRNQRVEPRLIVRQSTAEPSSR